MTTFPVPSMVVLQFAKIVAPSASSVPLLWIMPWRSRSAPEPACTKVPFKVTSVSVSVTQFSTITVPSLIVALSIVLSPVTSMVPGAAR